jgi:DNA replicative helicase MCM subunit Mcm2 (Cdc46/Mcm family)
VSENDPNIDYYAGKDIEPGKPTKYYHVQAKRMQEEEKTTMYIDYEHLCQFNPDEKDEDLPEDILANYYRFEAGLHRALHTFMARNFGDYANTKTFFLAFYNLPT